MDERIQTKITPEIITRYCLEHSSDEAEILQELEQKTRGTGQIKMMSGAFLGNFLSIISQSLQPDYILEVGSFTGYGSICLSRGLKEGGKIITIEKNPELKGFADEYYERLGISDKVTQLIGDASELIDSLDQQFDLVFIDAAKRQYVDYYEAILPKLRKGGVILADNTLWKGTVVEEERDKLAEGLDRFNKHVKKDPRVDNILLPIDDGVHYIIKK